MKTVKVTPDNIISVIDVNFDDFRDLQKAVGGHFEIVSTKTLFETFKMPMILLVDEDGRMKQKEVNRLGSYFYDADRHGWPILGDVVFAIAAGEDIEAPSDAEALRIPENEFFIFEDKKTLAKRNIASAATIKVHE